MATLAKRPNVRGVRVKSGGSQEKQKQNSRLLLVVAALLIGLSIAVPAAVMVFTGPAEYVYHDGYGHWEDWSSYVYTGMALSIMFGLAGIGIVLTVRREVTAYRTHERQNVKTAPSKATITRIALSFAPLVLIVGPVVFLTTERATFVGQWIGLSLLGAGLVGIAVTVRPLTTAASLVLPFAVVALMMGPSASPGSPGQGRILIGVGLAGIAVGLWGVSGSDPAVTHRWLLPLAIVAFVLALLGDAHMVLIGIPPILP